MRMYEIFFEELQTIFTLLSTFIMHISPSAKASRVGFPAKSSVLSSKLVAGLRRFDLILGLYWIVLDLTYFPCFGLGFKYFVVVTCRVAIFFSSHRVASCDSETSVDQFRLVSICYNQTKAYLYILHSRQCFLQAAALTCFFVCTSFHRCKSSWDF